MRPVAPRIDGVAEIQMARDQTEYRELTAGVVQFSNGAVGLITRWRLDEDDKERIANGEDVYLTIVTFGKPMQPVSIQVGPPE